MSHEEGDALYFSTSGLTNAPRYGSAILRDYFQSYLPLGYMVQPRATPCWALEQATTNASLRHDDIYNPASFKNPLPDAIQSRVAQCRALETLPPSHVTLDCLPLSPNYSRDDLIDRVSVMSGRIVARMVKDGKYNMYLKDFQQILAHLPPKYHDLLFAIRLTDDTTLIPYPILAKARKVGQHNATLIPLNFNRHFGQKFMDVLYKGDPTPYEKKIPAAFWRGASTGWNWNPDDPTFISRRHLLERWGKGQMMPLIDVGLSSLAQDGLWWHKKALQPYIKPQKKIKEQLKYRYLIAVEGNDVSSGLKWMLASNSVVLMPYPPTMESWLRESCLIPWVHFVPIRPDTSDLADKIRWCECNLDKCKAITQQATEYVRVYTSRDRVLKEAAQQVTMFMDAVKVELLYSSKPQSSTLPWVQCHVVTIDTKD